ncbi:MAG: UvrD-helicase domain-containing protein [Alphaproteobacteria bacterium]|nr:MAG: UvrD-helicase domain-containing protein [Alphaproteobacteria bacterium]
MITWIEASAGSGKTHSIIERVKDVLKLGAYGNSILCISFSNSAADELKSRLSHVDSDINFFTVHSLCNYFLGKTVIERNIAEDKISSLVNEMVESDDWFELYCLLVEDQNNLLDYIIKIVYEQKTIAIKNNDFKLEELLVSDQVINDLKNGGVLENKIANLQFENVNEVFEFFFTQDGSLKKKLYSVKWAKQFPSSVETLNNYLSELEKMYTLYIDYHNNLRSNALAKLIIHVQTLYEEYKLRNNLFDFTDLLKQFDINDFINKIMHIKHIFVDEAQDLSSEQWKVILDIFFEINSSTNCDLCIVGDQKQQIYFQDVGILESIKLRLKKYAKSKKVNFNEIILNNSYRTASSVLGFIDNVMSHTNYVTKHVAQNDLLGLVKVEIYKQKINVQDVIDSIKSVITGRGVEYKDIVILIKKRNVFTLEFFHELQLANIPIAEHPFFIREDTIVKELIFISKCSLFADDYALYCLAKSPFWNCSESELSEWFVNKRMSQNIDKFLNFIEQLKCYSTNIVSFYGELIFHTDYGKYLLNHGYSSVLEFWKLVVDFRQFSWFDFFEYIANAKVNVTYNNEGIKIKTIHSSKGMEFPVVFVIDDEKYVYTNEILYFNETILFPDKSNRNFIHALNKHKQERKLLNQRLMYVAMTRTKELLSIFAIENSFWSLIDLGFYKNFKLELTKNLKKL